MDYDDQKGEVTRHGNYLTAQDHVIFNGMKMREPWKKQMEQITKDLSDLTAMINNNDIACTDIDMSALGDKVNTLQDLIPIRIASIEEADREQGLFSDQPTNPCPQQIPSYSGTLSEDFITFKDNFKKAAEDNRISKTDQLDKLREALTGSAAPCIPPDGVTSVDDAWSILEKKFGDPLTHLNEMTFKANGNLLDTETEHENDIEASELTTFKAPLTSVDDAWSILEEAFGDPSTHFNLRLRIMKATQPLSDKTVETDPNKAAMWLL